MSAAEDPPSRKYSLTGVAICLTLLLATCAAYFPVTRFGFISFDDPAYVTANPHVIEGFTWRGLYWAFTSFDPDNWFPLTRLSHMLDYAAFGPRGAWHHAVNVVVHALASIMLFAFLRRGTRQQWPGAFVAAVFALHPLHVESVAWISERKDVLCAFFWFSALWAWIGYRQRPSKAAYAGALLLFAAGLMSKPMIVTLPLLLPLLEIWPLQRRWSPGVLLPVLPFAALSATAGILTLLAQNASGAMHSLQAVSFAERLDNALLTPFVYIGKTFWPAALSAVYPWPEHESLWLSIFAGISLAGISALVVTVRCERPYLAAGWFWFLITLLPVIGLVQEGPQARADRYMYVPMTGLLIMLAWGVAERVSRGVSHAIFAIAIAACLCLASLTWMQEQYWESNATLFRHAVALDDQNYLAWEYLGSSTDLNTELPARIECYRIALRIRPDFPDLRANLGAGLLQAGEVTESIGELETALRTSPHDVRTRCILGAALLRAGRVGDAASQLERAVKDDPDSAMARNDLAVALWRTNKTDARKQLEKAIALRPDYSLPHSNLGLVLLDTPGGVSEAVRQFVQALGIYPEDPTAHIGLARALAMPPFSDPAAAAAHLNTAHLLVLDPENFGRFETLRIDYGEHR